MISDYSKYKERVLSAYGKFLPLVEGVKKGKETSYDDALHFLSKRVVNIQQDKFLLMIAGEAKSGKSTFINAYLGKEILPMDVKQCTSAIVEIRYGEKFILKATYADGREEAFEDDEAIQGFLQNNAAMDDNYRDIPVAVLNMSLIIPKKDSRILMSEITEWVQRLQQENLYHLPAKEYADKIKQYVLETQKNWRNIVQKIEIQYPFDDEDMKGIEIIDTPGVNAEGQLGKITDEYIENANAIMFLKPLTGAALEATSFRKFLETKSADRNAGAKFLILTRAANETPENIKRIHAEALRQFPGINPKQIIAVDSKVELYCNKFQNMTVEEIGAYLMSETQAGRLDSFLLPAWFTAGNDRTKYLEALKELSRFANIDDALNLFAHKAQYIALSEFLEGMQTVLRKIKADLKEDIENRKLKVSNPEELENKLRNTNRSIENLKRKIRQTVDEISDKYSAAGGIIEAKADAVIEQYMKEIDGIDPSRSQSLDELEKISFRKIDIFTKYETQLQKEIVAECDRTLIEFSSNANINYTVIKPDLTPEVVAKIREEQKAKNTETHYYTTGGSFNKRTESYTEVNQSKYYGAFKKSIVSRIKKIRNDAVSDLHDFVVAVTAKYSGELTRNLKIKQEDYQKLLDEKKSVEEQLAEIARLEAVFESISGQLSDVDTLKGGVDKNV